MLTEKFNIGGKSGAPFYFTHDERYIIKMIPSDEMRGFVDIFMAYKNYFQMCPDSLLLRVYGCHCIKMRPGQPPSEFLVMANVRPREGRIAGHTKVHAEGTYDLKGSTEGRRNRKPGSHIKCTLLDQDYPCPCPCPRPCPSPAARA